MLFNTIDFAVFLPVVFLLYWFVFNRNLHLQNLFIVASSYFFYGWWDWRFLSLLAISTLIDYYVSHKLGYENRPRRRKLLLVISLCANLGMLGFFKYYNFFAENFIEVFQFFGHKPDIELLNIVLPVGISFYTFQTMSYSIDVYRRNLAPAKDIVSFFAYVSFFPQLVAGPIERATSLLPQFYNPRVFDYDRASDGMRQILWGLFKKMVIADNCAEYVNLIYSSPENYSGSTLALASVLFAFQIYCDFSGYSDIAIGLARLFGFNLMKNFAFPYFSRDIAEFWRRWHISLSTWFRDYVYIPLGGSKAGLSRGLFNVFVIFIVSGFWHGDRWTFVIWGLLNAIYFIPLMLLNQNRRNLDVVSEGRIFIRPLDALKILVTFTITTVAWVFFRAESVSHAMTIFAGMASPSLFSIPQLLPEFTLLLVAILIMIEWLGRHHEFAIEKIFPRNMTLRWSCYLLIAFLISIFSGKEQIFIYFQF